VDALLCSVQTGTQESQASRSRSLRVRLGVVATLVIMIEYYPTSEVPKTARKSRFRPNSAGGSFCFRCLKRSRCSGTFARLDGRCRCQMNMTLLDLHFSVFLALSRSMGLL